MCLLLFVFFVLCVLLFVCVLVLLFVFVFCFCYLLFVFVVCLGITGIRNQIKRNWDLVENPILGKEYCVFGAKSVIWAHKTGPKYIKNITNGVPVARHGLTLGEDEARAAGPF